jgi:hypothetical protein
MALAVTASLAVSGFICTAQTVPKSPEGTWDLLISGGGQRGISFLSFSNENTISGTFSGVRVLVGTPTSGGSIADIDDSRNGGGDDTRQGFTGGTTTPTGRSHLYGFDRVSGYWQHDINGRVIGTFVETTGAGVTCTTNENITTIQGTTTVGVTNEDGSTTYYTTNTYIFVTNPPTVTCVTNEGVSSGVTFLGSVVPGRRLTLVASTANGKITYNGIPYRTNLTDLSGPWYATKLMSEHTSLDTFSLTPFPEYQNIYSTTDGQSELSPFEGVAILSARKKVGFAFLLEATDFPLGAAYGSLGFSRSATILNLKGGQLDSQIPTPFTYRAVQLPPPVP